MALRKQPTTTFIPALRDAGIPHVVGAAELGVGVQVTAAVTLAGGGPPHPILFSDLKSQSGEPILPMLDTDYVPVVVGDSAAEVDLSTRTRDGFTLAGGADADVVAFVIFGRFGAMKR